MRKTDTRLTTSMVAYASLGAGAVHLAVIPGHWAEWPPSGTFFLGVAAFQLLWAAAVVLFPRAVLVVLGAAVNAAVMLLWGVSRTWGVPVGPHAGEPETVGVAGVMTLALEAVVVVGSLWYLLPRKQMAILSSGGYRFALVAGALIVFGLAAPGAAAGLEHGQGGQGHEHGGGHADARTRGPSPERSCHHEEMTPTPSAGEPSPDSGRPSRRESGHDDDHDH